MRRLFPAREMRSPRAFDPLIYPKVRMRRDPASFSEVDSGDVLVPVALAIINTKY